LILVLHSLQISHTSLFTISDKRQMTDQKSFTFNVEENFSNQQVVVCIQIKTMRLQRVLWQQHRGEKIDSCNTGEKRGDSVSGLSSLQ